MTARSEDSNSQSAGLDRLDGPDIRPYRNLCLPPIEVGYPFTRELEVCIGFLNFVGEHLAERFWRAKNGASRIILAEHARSASLYYAVLCLALDGCGVEAELLCRPMFESLVTSSWADAHPGEAAERFTLHEKYVWRLHAEARAKTGRFPDDPPPPTLTEAEAARASKMFGKYGERSWTGKRPWQLADAFLAYTDARGPTRQTLVEYIELIHPFINWSLHSTAIAGTRIQEPYTDDYVRAIVGPSDHGVRSALVQAWNSFSGLCWIMVKHFGIEELEPAFQAQTRRVTDAFDRARNAE